MKFEVERKYRVADLAEIEARVRKLPARLGLAVTQVDAYYAHPCRDFAVTDEALRIRRVGEQNFVTYKGPKIDLASKTRRELELPLAPGGEGATQFAELLTALGFQLVSEVRKRRRIAELDWRGASTEIALDEVEGVGTFIEIELSADESGLETAQAQLAALADVLELKTGERRSYLEMLLAGRKSQ
jgi:adenylate cyclase class 2